MKLKTICKSSAAPLLLLGAAFLTSTAFAGSLTLSITGQAGAGKYAGVAAAPYYMSVIDPHGNSSSILVASDDYDTHFKYNKSWTGNVFSLTGTTVANLKFGMFGMTTYEQAAVIFTDLMKDSSLEVAGSVAIWSLFEPGSVNVSSVPGAQAELNHAAAAVAAGGLDYSGVKIYTPTPKKSSGEFISGAVTALVVTPPTAPTPAPEPATYAMLGGGLIIVGCARRRARRG
jgi:hypothetical protein